MFKNKDGKVSIKNCIVFESLVANFTSENLKFKTNYIRWCWRVWTVGFTARTGVFQYRRETYVVKMEVKLFSCFIKHVLGTYGNMEVKFHAFIILWWIEMNGLASYTTFFQGKHWWCPLDGTFDWYLKLVWRLMRSFTVHEIKRRFIGHSVRSLVTLLNELYHHLLAL